MTEPFDTNPSDTNASLEDTSLGEPLGIKHPLGMNFIQPKFLQPLGATPLGILDTAALATGLNRDRAPDLRSDLRFEQRSAPQTIIQTFSDSLSQPLRQQPFIESNHQSTASDPDLLDYPLNSDYAEHNGSEGKFEDNSIERISAVNHVLEAPVQRSKANPHEEPSDLGSISNPLSATQPEANATEQAIIPPSPYLPFVSSATDKASITVVQSAIDVPQQNSSKTLATDSFITANAINAVAEQHEAPQSAITRDVNSINPIAANINTLQRAEFTDITNIKSTGSPERLPEVALSTPALAIQPVSETQAPLNLETTSFVTADENADTPDQLHPENVSAVSTSSEANTEEASIPPSSNAPELVQQFSDQENSSTLQENNSAIAETSIQTFSLSNPAQSFQPQASNQASAAFASETKHETENNNNLTSGLSNESEVNSSTLNKIILRNDSNEVYEVAQTAQVFDHYNQEYESTDQSSVTMSSQAVSDDPKGIQAENEASISALSVERLTPSTQAIQTKNELFTDESLETRIPLTSDLDLPQIELNTPSTAKVEPSSESEAVSESPSLTRPVGDSASVLSSPVIQNASDQSTVSSDRSAIAPNQSIFNKPETSDTTDQHTVQFATTHDQTSFAEPLAEQVSPLNEVISDNASEASTAVTENLLQTPPNPDQLSNQSTAQQQISPHAVVSESSSLSQQMAAPSLATTPIQAFSEPSIDSPSTLATVESVAQDSTLSPNQLDRHTPVQKAISTNQQAFTAPVAEAVPFASNTPVQTFSEPSVIDSPATSTTQEYTDKNFPARTLDKAPVVAAQASVVSTNEAVENLPDENNFSSGSSDEATQSALPKSTIADSSSHQSTAIETTPIQAASTLEFTPAVEVNAHTAIDSSQYAQESGFNALENNHAIAPAQLKADELIREETLIERSHIQDHAAENRQEPITESLVGQTSEPFSKASESSISDPVITAIPSIQPSFDSVPQATDHSDSTNIQTATNADLTNVALPDDVVETSSQSKITQPTDHSDSINVQTATNADLTNTQLKEGAIEPLSQLKNIDQSTPLVQLKDASILGVGSQRIEYSSTPNVQPAAHSDSPNIQLQGASIEPSSHESSSQPNRADLKSAPSRNADAVVIPLALDQSSHAETDATFEENASEPTVAQMLAEGTLPTLPTAIAPLSHHSPLGTQTSLLPSNTASSDAPSNDIAIAQASPSIQTDPVQIQAFPSGERVTDSWLNIEELLNNTSPHLTNNLGGEPPQTRSEDLSRHTNGHPIVVQPSVTDIASTVTPSNESPHIRASAGEPVQFSLDDGDTDGDTTGSSGAADAVGMPVVARGVPIPDTLQGVPGATEYVNTRLASTVAHAVGEILPQDNQKPDTINLEPLAREIYGLLRQRLEIERERRNALPYSGRLPW